MPWDRVHRARSAPVVRRSSRAGTATCATTSFRPGFTTAHSVFVLGFSRPRQGRPRRLLRDGSAGSRRLRRRLVDQAGAAPLRLERAAAHRRHWPERLLRQRRAPVAAPRRSGSPAAPTGPTFQSYWDTSKAPDAPRQAGQRRRARPVGQSPFVLKVDRPAPAADAQPRPRRGNLAKPARSWKRAAVTGVSASATSASSCAPSRMAKVTAAAAGRVVFRGWSLNGGALRLDPARTQPVHDLHGPRHASASSPANGSKKGTTLGRVDRHGRQEDRAAGSQARDLPVQRVRGQPALALLAPVPAALPRRQQRDRSTDRFTMFLDQVTLDRHRRRRR